MLKRRVTVEPPLKPVMQQLGGEKKKKAKEWHAHEIYMQYPVMNVAIYCDSLRARQILYRRYTQSRKLWPSNLGIIIFFSPVVAYRNLSCNFQERFW